MADSQWLEGSGICLQACCDAAVAVAATTSGIKTGSTRKSVSDACRALSPHRPLAICNLTRVRKIEERKARLLASLSSSSFSRTLLLKTQHHRCGAASDVVRRRIRSHCRCWRCLSLFKRRLRLRRRRRRRRRGCSAPQRGSAIK